MANLYTKLKVFHFQKKLDSLPAGVGAIMAPIHVRIKPTNVCNHRCWYCAYTAEALQLGKNMVAKDSIPREKMLEIVEDLAEMGVRAVTFSGGGEPFCYPHLTAALRKLIEHRIEFASLTNGSLITGEAIELFSRHGTWVRISMDGWDDASYMKYRKVKNGEFTKILSNIKAFKALRGRCLMGVSFILDRDNYPHLYDLAGQLKAAGVDSLKIAPCIVADTGESNSAYHAAFFDEAQAVIERVRRGLVDEKFELYNAYHEQQVSFRKDYTWCPYIQILPVIGADLNVYSCHDKAYNLQCGLLGSLKDMRFKDLWFADKRKFFEINPARDCGHHCVAHERNLLIHEYLNADEGHLRFV